MLTAAGRATRSMAILALPEGKDSAGMADALIEHTSDLPAGCPTTS